MSSDSNTNIRQTQLPDRKRISLCEAVSASVYGEARDAQQFQGDKGPKHQITKPEYLLARLREAGYAGRIRFYGVKEFGNTAEGWEEIDPMFFSVSPVFNWPQDAMRHDSEYSTPWYFVHLDREGFVSLLGDMGISVQQEPDPPGPDAAVPDERKTYNTGVAGRPSSQHLVREMARRRFEKGDIPDTLTQLAEQLAEQLKNEEPLAAPMTAKTIANRFRDEWRPHLLARKRPK
jgi:hypothetical protein